MAQKVNYFETALIVCALLLTVVKATRNVSVVEGLDGNGQLVYNITECSQHRQENSQLYFRLEVFNGRSSMFYDYFTWDDGVITTRRNLSRDEMASMLSNPHLPVSFHIRCSVYNPPTIIEEQDIHLMILDLNNNAPSFNVENGVESIEIRETSETQYVLELANDSDQGENSTQTYYLMPPPSENNPFSLIVRRNEDNFVTSLRLNISLLDRETQSNYILYLTAQENTTTNPHPPAHLTINVTVLDVCDENPMFESSRFQTSIVENSPRGSTVITNITATDSDLLDQGQLRYSIERVCFVDFVGDTCEGKQRPSPFRLDHERGDLTIVLEADMLDREQFVGYEVRILVEDTCGGSATAIVEVTVEDVNDNPPQPQIYGSEIILETDGVDSVDLFSIDVVDPDFGINSQFSISLQDNLTGVLMDSEVFYLTFSNNRWVIRNRLPLDREERSSYSLVLNTTDMGTPTMSTITPLPITIGDSNDNSPIFNAIDPVYFIQEEPVVGISSITTVTATDADSVESGNGQVIYTIPPSNTSYPFQDYFRVMYDGDVVVARRLDREQQDHFFVLVEARDNATSEEPRTDYVVINVTLEDINDVTPVIVSPPSNIIISETQPNGSVVFTVVAYDNDTEPFSTLTYSLTPDSTPFAIDPTLGQVTLVLPLDYETTTSYSLRVSVTDGLNSEHKNINVTVENVNDERCIFDDTVIYSTSVNESEPAHYRVFTIRASDRDTPFQQLTFSIIDGNKNNSFSISISHSKATIHTTYSLDNEGISNYTLTLECSDGSMHPTTTQLFVQVLDINDNLPRFDQSDYSFEVSEQLNSNVMVGQVHADDSDSGSNGAILYSLAVAAPNGALNWFYINQNDGRIFTSVQLDREDPLLEGRQGMVRLKVTATDMPSGRPLQSGVYCYITIEDINDNSPIFQERTINITVPESLSLGSSLRTIMATDRDSPPFNEIEYQISENTDEGERFELDQTTGVLKLHRMTLDYEQQRIHTFEVQAIDVDSPERRDYQTINVNVTNDEEIDIQFEGFNTNVAVRENAPINHTVTQFQVTDKEGRIPILRSFDVSFTIIDRMTGAESQNFGLTNNSYNSTLIVYVRRNIDRETFNPENDGTVFKEFNITASSAVHGSVSAIMTITILDDNDNYPKFSGTPYSFTVHENNDIAVSIGTVSATDIDFGSNGSPGITYSVNHPLFRIAQDGELTSTESLDYEKGQHSFNFILTASDGGSPPKTNSTPVSVHVIDVNDNSPQFNPTNNRTFYFSENIPVNSVVERLDVSDLDSGIFGEVNVSMGNIPSQHFEVFPNGDINVALELDRERVPSYFFTVVATDGGGRKTTAEITVVVEDYNDNKPVFNPIPTIILNETQPSDQVFYTVTATDIDVGNNATVEYAIGDRSLSETFCINSITGGLSLCSQHWSCGGMEILNYEHRMRYNLNVVAYDLGIPRNIVSQNITIIIRPVNEHAPQFDRSALFVYVNETRTRDVAVATIQAIDLDIPDQISYQVTGIDRGAFRYDATRNALISNIVLNYNEKSYYEITLVATDSGGRSNSMSIIVIVINVNDHPPIIDQNSLPRVLGLDISERTPVSTVVWQVRATDEDDDNFDAIEYHLENPLNDMRFRIDSLTGEILVNRTLDHEETDTYRLSVFATDTGSPQHTSQSVTIPISIIDENDEPVMFNSSSYTFNVPERTPVGTAVGQLYASDRDGDGISYSIVSGINEYFDIHTQNGYIFTLRELDREALPYLEFFLTVHATDNAPGSQDTAIARVHVNIIDINDNPPILSSKQYLVSISPGQQVNASIATTISAADSDSGSYAQYHYEVEGSPSNLRIAVMPSGQLVLEEPVPRDNYQLSYSYILRAVDSNNQSLSSTARLELLVETASDHHPRFRDYETIEHIDEGSPNGTEIVTLNSIVSDPDPGDVLSYAFSEDYPKFNIDSASGRIILNGELDYEDVREYTLTVLATDSRPGMHRTSTGIVQVVVDPVNEYAPDISPLKSQYVFSYISITGIDLFTVSSSDRDEGEENHIQYTINDASLLLTIDRQQGTVRNRAALETDMDFEVTISVCDCGITALTRQVSVRISIRNPGPSKPVITGMNPRTITRAEDTEVDDLLNSPLVTNPNPMTQTYHLVKQTLLGSDNHINTFSITESNGRLVLEQALDYEEADMYSLVIESRVTTTNSTSETRASDFLQVIIEVTNVNDNYPVFIPVPRQSFSESVSVGSPLFRVEATDRDLGPEGILTYVLCQGSTDGTFGINRTSGQVKLERAFDREIVRYYTLCIQASDKSISPHSAQIRVHVDITDVNDYATTFGNRNYSLSVYEFPSTKPGTRVMKLPAIDLDEGQLRYTMILQEVRHNMSNQINDINPYFGNFNIDPFTGSISVSSVSLDRETADEYLYLVTATDNINRAQTYLTIHILDVDDHPPQLMMPSARVREGAPPGMLVTDEIEVTDRDIGINSWVLYSLGRNWPGDYFRIDPLSGVIRVNQQIVYKNRTFQGEVIVQGQGASRYRVTGFVPVIIEDINNHAPMFDSSSIMFKRVVGSMSSNEVWTELHQFTVEDEDFALNAFPVEFEIPSYYNEVRENFEVLLSNSKGVLQMREPQAKIKTYNFRIDVYNSAYTPMCAQYMQASSINVTVEITPVNRGGPQFTQAQNLFEVTEELDDFSQSIGSVEAVDVDGDLITFSLVNPSAPFRIESSGYLYATGPLDREANSSYVLTVAATDAGFPSITNTSRITVIVTDINDNKPIFTRSVYNKSVVENLPINTTVLSVSADDDDSDDNARVFYQMNDNRVPFSIVPTTGVIMVSGNIDFEFKSSYLFNVTALDGGNPPQSSCALVSISLTDVNEFPPTFPPSPLDPIQVDIDTSVGDVVYTVVATDPDFSEDLTYSFVNSEPKCYFNINSKTGDITVKDFSSNDNTCPSLVEDPTQPDYFQLPAVVKVSDGLYEQQTTINFRLHRLFIPVVTEKTSSLPIEIISASILGVVIVILIFVVIVIVACICRWKKNKYVIDGVNRSVEMKRFGSNRSHNSTANGGSIYKQTTSLGLPPEHTTVSVPAGSGASSARHSYIGNIDSEAGNERGSYHSPATLSGKSHLKCRSTSDLGSSTMNTDIMSGNSQENTPYDNPQIKRIYAKNADLLDDQSGSNESIHMFGSEGGGESDGGDDLYGKFHEYDDDDDSTTMQDDEEEEELDNEISFRRRDSRENMGLNIDPVEVPCYGHDNRDEMSWSPRITNMAETIDQIAYDTGHRHSQHFVMDEYSKSQEGMSGYGAGGTQDSSHPLLRDNRRLMHHQHHMVQQQPDFYYDSRGQDTRLHEHHMMRGPPPNYSASSSTGLPTYSSHDLQQHHPMSRHSASGGGMGVPPVMRGASQEVPPMYDYHHDNYFHHPLHHDMGTAGTHSPSSTPTEEALNTRNEYESDILFSSDTSLNTNTESEQFRQQQQIHQQQIHQQQIHQQQIHQQMHGPPRGFSQSSQRGFSQSSASQRHPYR